MQASFVSPSVFFTQLQGAMLNTSQVVTVRATNATSIHRPSNAKVSIESLIG